MRKKPLVNIILQLKKSTMDIYVFKVLTLNGRNVPKLPFWDTKPNKKNNINLIFAILPAYNQFP